MPFLVTISLRLRNPSTGFCYDTGSGLGVPSAHLFLSDSVNFAAGGRVSTTNTTHIWHASTLNLADSAPVANATARSRVGSQPFRHGPLAMQSSHPVPGIRDSSDEVRRPVRFPVPSFLLPPSLTGGEQHVPLCSSGLSRVALKNPGLDYLQG